MGLLFLVITLIGMDFYGIMIPATFILFVYLLNKYAKHQIFLIIFIYIFVYFWYLCIYFYTGRQLSQHFLYQRRLYFNKILLLFYLFFLGFAFSVPFIKDRRKQIALYGNLFNFSNAKRNIFIIFCLILLFLTFRMGANIFQSKNLYKAYVENIHNTSALPFIFLVFCFIYMLIKHNNKYIVLFFVCAYTYFCITRGMRIPLVPVWIAFYLRYFENKIGNIFLYALTFAGLILLLVMGNIKAGIELTSLFSTDYGNTYILSHHADELYGVAAGYGLIDSNIITGFDRLKAGASFFLQMIIPPSFFSDSLRFPQIITSNARTGGGGLVMFGAYLFWGYGGVVLFSFIFSRMVISAYGSKNKLFLLWIFITLAFSCNWISYDFLNILRFPFLACIIVLCYKSVKLCWIKNSEKNLDC